MRGEHQAGLITRGPGTLHLSTFLTLLTLTSAAAGEEHDDDEGGDVTGDVVYMSDAGLGL